MTPTTDVGGAPISVPSSCSATIPMEEPIVMTDHRPKRKRDTDFALEDVESLQPGGDHGNDAHLEAAIQEVTTSFPPPRKRRKVRHATTNSKMGGKRGRRAVACAVATVARRGGNVALWSQDPPSSHLLAFPSPRFHRGNDGGLGAVPSFYRSLHEQERGGIESILFSSDVLTQDSVHTSVASPTLATPKLPHSRDLASSDAPATAGGDVWMFPDRCTAPPSSCQWHEVSGPRPLRLNAVDVGPGFHNNSSHHDSARDLQPQNVTTEAKQDRRLSLKGDFVLPAYDFSSDRVSALSHWTIRSSFFPPKELATWTGQVGMHRTVGVERGIPCGVPFAQGYQLQITAVSNSIRMPLRRAVANLTSASRASEFLERPGHQTRTSFSDSDGGPPHASWTSDSWPIECSAVATNSTHHASPMVALDLPRETREGQEDVRCASRDRVQFQHDAGWIFEPNISPWMQVYDTATNFDSLELASFSIPRNETFSAQLERKTGLKRKIEMVASNATSANADSKRMSVKYGSHRPAFVVVKRQERVPRAAQVELDSCQARSNVGNMKVQLEAISLQGRETREVAAALTNAADAAYMSIHASPFRSMIVTSKLVLVFTARLALDHVTTASRLGVALKHCAAGTTLVPSALTNWIRRARGRSGNVKPPHRQPNHSRDRRAIAKR
jgi:hypothetical protein